MKDGLCKLSEKHHNLRFLKYLIKNAGIDLLDENLFKKI